MTHEDWYLKILFYCLKFLILALVPDCHFLTFSDFTSNWPNTITYKLSSYCIFFTFFMMFLFLFSMVWLPKTCFKIVYILKFCLQNHAEIFFIVVIVTGVLRNRLESRLLVKQIDRPRKDLIQLLIEKVFYAKNIISNVMLRRGYLQLHFHLHSFLLLLFYNHTIT